MRRVLPSSLAWQFIGFLLAALVVSQALAFLVSRQEKFRELDNAAKSEFYSRARTMTLLMDRVPQEYRLSTLQASETSNSRFWLTAEPPGAAAEWRQQAVVHFARPLENFVDVSQFFNDAPTEAQLPDAATVAQMNAGDDWRRVIPGLWALPQAAQYLFFEGERGYGLIIDLGNGTWLNAAFYTQDQGGWWTSESIGSLALAAAALALIGALIAGRITQPLRRLAQSAEALGRGETLPPLAEDGPDEVRATAEAFNRMQERLHRFIDDRTRMLAAIGHDLRTPLTTLRLRSEFVTEPETRQKMLAAVDELQDLTEAALALSRDGLAQEETRDIQIEALVASLCDDLADLGQPVTVSEGGRTRLRCRPGALRRAIRNLIENAVRYGEQADVSFRQSESGVEVVVQDRGAGIPDGLHETVFAPFYRMEGSRNRNTGGAGLGLTIARAIARQHGGDIRFINGTKGMQAILSLPLSNGLVARRAAQEGRGWFGRLRSGCRPVADP